jgi:hypothetical protein
MKNHHPRKRQGGSAAPSGDAKGFSASPTFLTSSKGLLDPPIHRYSLMMLPSRRFERISTGGIGFFILGVFR